jgi:DNA (cytosine-5)-methyltransferase 1
VQNSDTIKRLDELLTVKEAAGFLGVSPNTVRNWGRTGKIAELRHPINQYRLFRREDLSAFLQRANQCPEMSAGNVLKPNESPSTEQVATSSRMGDIRTLSLFSGAGGLDLGFHRSGFNILTAVELESKYCRTLEANCEHFFGTRVDVINQDVTRFDPSKIKTSGVDCIIGGPPCQTFSAAGRRSGGVIGTNDKRGQLYETYCSLLDTLRPPVFVFENVYGLPGANGGKPWREIVRAFHDHGYELFFEVVDSADYGVPQHRERLIMVGVRGGSQFRFPLPTHGPDSPTSVPLVSVLDAIGDLQSKHERFSEGLGGLYGHLLPEVPEGLNYAFFTAEMGHPYPVFAWRSKFHDLLYKVDRNSPCRTIKANPGKFTGPLHWKNRHFTAGELKRLQTFPDEYQIVGSYKQVLEQVGNSVPPRLAEVIATSVREQILDNVPDSELTYPVRHDGFKSTFRQRQRERSKAFKSTAQKAIRKKYGKTHDYVNPADIKPKLSTYFVDANGFSRTVLSKRPKNKPYADVSVADSNGKVRVDYDYVSEGSNLLTIDININGLRKYLPRVDSVCVKATVPHMESLFGVWKEIEATLVERSNFFTLIDIYGHYANRGDDVDVSTTIATDSDTDCVAILRHFSQTENCGSITQISETLDAIGTSEESFRNAVFDLRDMRYDLRTIETHPIIGKGNVLCTYPFPLLSPKALVESKAKLNRAF